MQEVNIQRDVQDVLEKETPETNEVADTLNTAEPEKVEKSNDLQSALAQKEHFRAKFEKTEAEKKALEERLKGFTSQTTGNPMEAVRLGKALAEHSEEETDVIITYAKGKFNTLTPNPEQIIQASKDDWVQTAIKARREKVESERKTPEPSSPSSISGNVTTEDVEKMDKKKFANFIKGINKGGRSGI